VISKLARADINAKIFTGFDTKCETFCHFGQKLSRRWLGWKAVTSRKTGKKEAHLLQEG